MDRSLRSAETAIQPRSPASASVPGPLVDCRVWGTPPEASFDACVALAAALFHAPIASLCFTDGTRLWRKAGVGIPPGPAAAASPDGEVLAAGTSVVIARTSEHPLGYSGWHVEFPHVAAFVGVPVVLDSGRPVGVLSVADVTPRSFDPTTIALLEQVARQVEAQMQERRAAARADGELRWLATGAEHIAGLGSWWEARAGGDIEWSEGLRRLLAVPPGLPVDRDLLLSLCAPPHRDRAVRILGCLPHDDGQSVIADTDADAHAESVDLEMRRWDGSTRIMQARSEVVLDPGGIARRRGTFQDVTDLRASALAITDATERARSLLRALPDAVVVADADGRIMEVNPRAEELFAYAREDLVGRPVEVLLPTELHRPHRAHRARWAASAAPTLMTARPGLLGRRSDGRTVPVEINLAAIQLPSGPAVVATIRDVTEARSLQRQLTASHELLAGVLGAATEQAVVAVDLAGRITLFNPGAERLTGYREEEVRGRTVAVLAPPGDPSAAVHPLGIPLSAPTTTPAGALTGPAAGATPGHPDAQGHPATPGHPDAPGHAANPGHPATTGDPGARTAPASTVPASTVESVVATRDGALLSVSSSVTAMTDAVGRTTGFVAIATDITGQRAALEALALSEERFRRTFSDAPFGMCLVGLHGEESGRMLQVNTAMCELTGYREDQLVGAHVHVLNLPEARQGTDDAIASLVTGEAERWTMEKQYRCADGSLIWVHITTSVVRDGGGTPVYMITHVQDVTTRRRIEAQLQHQASHDSLTGLPNRALLLDHLQRALGRANRTGTCVGAVFVDLDRFKAVNDTLGHSAGDRFLVEIARRISSVLRDSDLPARLGGDEFVVVCDDLPTPDQAAVVASRIAAAIRQPLELDGTLWHPTASIGVATSVPGSTPEDLLSEADARMYRFKHG